MERKRQNICAGINIHLDEGCDRLKLVECFAFIS